MKRSVILVLSAVFLISGFLFFLGQMKASGQNNPLQENIMEGIEMENLARDFALHDPVYGNISKATFQGKPLFIFFTTTWCVPCQIGAQNLARYDDETGGKAFSVLIVFVDGSEIDQQFLDWKERFGRSDWFVAKGIEMAKTYQVQYLDTKYVLDKNGIVGWSDTRPLEYAGAKRVLQPLL